MEIIDRCRSKGLFLHPDARKKLENINNPDKVIEEVFDSLKDKETVVLPEHIDEQIKVVKDREDSFSEKDISESKYSESNSSEVEKDLDKNFEIKKDITDQSECEGELKDFLNYFNRRFEKLSKEIRKRNGMGKARPIESLDDVIGEVSVIGIVKDIRDTSNGHRLIRLEDKSDQVPTLALKNEKDVFKESEKILLDEVIGVQGKISKGSDLLIINKIIWPELPIQNEPNSCDEKKYSAFISDIHFGSESFLEESWNKFVRWLNGEVGNSNHKRIAKKIDYLVIAGDLVEGVGVYPGQKEELSINSIKGQYKKAAEELSKFRNDLKIFISPGNHDAVRQAEPQPALCDEMKEPFKGIENIEFIGNPCLLNLEGVDVLVYHGRSLDDLVADLPSKNYEEPAEIMKEFIRRRHLAPSYGKKTPIAPEKQDYLFVENPDIIHSGHIHKVGVDKYKGVRLLNTGTWQGQTKFQRKKGIKPTIGRVVVYNLKNHNQKIVKFNK